MSIYFRNFWFEVISLYLYIILLSSAPDVNGN